MNRELKDRYHLLLTQLLVIHGSMPNEELNRIVGSSIDCIEKMNQYINTLERMNNNQFDRIESMNKKTLDIVDDCFHAYASSYLEDAKEKALKMLEE